MQRPFEYSPGNFLDLAEIVRWAVNQHPLCVSVLLKNDELILVEGAAAEKILKFLPALDDPKGLYPR